jgi:hypothetical protein
LDAVSLPNRYFASCNKRPASIVDLLALWDSST